MSWRSSLVFASCLVVGGLIAQEPRLHTSRTTGAQLLKLPKEDDAFGFVVFGDRTGGPPEGIAVLKQAVTDTNLLDPDLVLTVGDLVQGYNRRAAWLAQAKEFKDTMAGLRMPWFPVAGNHDVYWRGPDKPVGEHEGDYEATFGPLWYSVQHKRCCFVVLYSDEGDPQTGEKDFHKPACQRVSKEQFAWLEQTLQRSKQARHVFVFLHHPRWLAQYGDDWQRVHALLAANGNVRAVFAGHIHRVRFDGVRDGIEYHTVASVGAELAMDAPQAGYLHEFHVVTVRPEGIQVAAVPVGALIDPRQIDGRISEDAERVHDGLQVELESVAKGGDGEAVALDGTVDAIVTLRCRNPGSRPVDLELLPLADADWVFGPDHQHVVVPGNSVATTTFAVRHVPPAGLPFALPQLQVKCDYLAPDRRLVLPPKRFLFPLPPPKQLGEQRGKHAGVLVLDGSSACLRLPSDSLGLPDGPFTIEAWVFAEDVRGRRGIVSKAENSECGLLAVDGALQFPVFLGERYATARTAQPVLRAGVWQHVAGVFDGAHVRLFVDGALVAEVAGAGPRKANALPWYVGADTQANGQPTSFFAGAIDDVRISKVARYAAAFTPSPQHERDADTVWLLPCDEDFGPWTADASGNARHARRVGTAHCTLEARPGVR